MISALRLIRFVDRVCIGQCRQWCVQTEGKLVVADGYYLCTTTQGVAGVLIRFTLIELYPLSNDKSVRVISRQPDLHGHPGTRHRNRIWDGLYFALCVVTQLGTDVKSSRWTVLPPDNNVCCLPDARRS